MSELLLYGIALTILVVSDLLLVALGVMAWRLYHRSGPPQSSAAEDTERHGEVRQDIKNLAVAMSMLGERLVRLEDHLERLQDRLQDRDQPQTGGGGSKDGERKAFEVATKLALKGANVEELITVCGLTRGEAELIRMLHSGERAKTNRLA